MSTCPALPIREIRAVGTLPSAETVSADQIRIDARAALIARVNCLFWYEEGESVSADVDSKERDSCWVTVTQAPTALTLEGYRQESG
jgi:hypothetical protein